jgi:hypothetical protein
VREPLDSVTYLDELPEFESDAMLRLDIDPLSVPLLPANDVPASLELSSSSAAVSPAELRDAVTVNYRSTLSPPLFVLAMPRSFTSLVCAMFGQHPEMFGLPETHLLCEPTVQKWVDRSDQASWPMSHGLVRAVAELYFGRQDERTVRWANAWVRARGELTTEQLFKLIADRVHPLRVVDKSPSTIDNVATMRRAFEWFPDGYFLHLVRHPRGYAESILKLAERKLQRHPIPSSHWLVQFAAVREPATPATERDTSVVLDPQHGWLQRNTMIRDFMASLPTDRRMTLRAEDVVLQPDTTLRGIADWLGLRTDQEAIEQMVHPERSPFAFPGPPRARYGNDGNFLDNPALRPSKGQIEGLEEPLAWKPGEEGFLPRVKELAADFGYR